MQFLVSLAPTSVYSRQTYTLDVNAISGILKDDVMHDSPIDLVVSSLSRTKDEKLPGCSLADIVSQAIEKAIEEQQQPTSSFCPMCGDRPSSHSSGVARNCSFAGSMSSLSLSLASDLGGSSRYMRPFSPPQRKKSSDTLSSCPDLWQTNGQQLPESPVGHEKAFMDQGDRAPPCLPERKKSGCLRATDLWTHAEESSEQHCNDDSLKLPSRPLREKNKGALDAEQDESRTTETMASTLPSSTCRESTKSIEKSDDLENQVACLTVNENTASSGLQEMLGKHESSAKTQSVSTHADSISRSEHGRLPSHFATTKPLEDLLSHSEHGRMSSHGGATKDSRANSDHKEPRVDFWTCDSAHSRPEPPTLPTRQNTRKWLSDHGQWQDPSSDQQSNNTLVRIPSISVHGAAWSRCLKNDNPLVGVTRSVSRAESAAGSSVSSCPSFENDDAVVADDESVSTCGSWSRG